MEERNPRRIVFRARNLTEGDKTKLFEYLTVQSAKVINSELTEYDALVDPVKVHAALQMKEKLIQEEISVFCGKDDQNSIMQSIEEGDQMLDDYFQSSKPKSESYLSSMKDTVEDPKLLPRARKVVSDLTLELDHLNAVERREDAILIRKHQLLLLSSDWSKRNEERCSDWSNRTETTTRSEQPPGDGAQKSSKNDDKVGKIVKGEMGDKIDMRGKGDKVDMAEKDNMKKRKISVVDLEKVLSKHDKAKSSVVQICDKIDEYKRKYLALKEKKDVEDEKYLKLQLREIMLRKQLRLAEHQLDEQKECVHSLVM